MTEIDAYLARLDKARQAALGRVVAIARRTAPKATPGTSYGMAALRFDGKPLLGLNDAKEHLSLHPFSPSVVAAVAGDLEGYSLSKGTIRFTPDHPIPEEVIERIVRLRVAEIGGDRSASS